ncbi:MAG: hypothetical protein LAP40_07005 [Acidobacteriia bacterium]|nr:hypothetical protein [Terriglobia bacterium]
MLATVLILTVSVALLIYWFRYCCIGLLRSHADQRFLVPENRYNFPQVRERLFTDVDLDPLHHSLDRDYRVVTYLLRHATGLGAPSVERRLLLLDYRLMHAWYRFARMAAPSQARKALRERVEILGCLAQMMGEQAGVRGAA